MQTKDSKLHRLFHSSIPINIPTRSFGPLLVVKHVSFLDICILWDTPSAAGARSLRIALGLQILGIVVSRSWHSWYPNLIFGMVGGLTLASWGTLGRSWDIGERKEGHFEVQARVSVDFLWI